MKRKILFLQLTLLCATQYAHAALSKDSTQILSNRLKTILNDIFNKNFQEAGNETDHQLPHFKELDLFLFEHPEWANSTGKWTHPDTQKEHNQSVLMFVASATKRIPSTLTRLIRGGARVDDRNSEFSALDIAIDSFPFETHPFVRPSGNDMANIEVLYAASSPETRAQALRNAKSFLDKSTYPHEGACSTQREQEEIFHRQCRHVSRQRIYAKVSELAKAAADKASRN